MYIHQDIPEDCKYYNNGLICKSSKCQFIHSNADREEALRMIKQKKGYKVARSPTAKEAQAVETKSAPPSSSNVKSENGSYKLSTSVAKTRPVKNNYVAKYVTAPQGKNKQRLSAKTNQTFPKNTKEQVTHSKSAIDKQLNPGATYKTPSFENNVKTKTAPPRKPPTTSIQKPANTVSRRKHSIVSPLKTTSTAVSLATLISHGHVSRKGVGICRGAGTSIRSTEPSTRKNRVATPTPATQAFTRTKDQPTGTSVLASKSPREALKLESFSYVKRSFARVFSEAIGPSRSAINSLSQEERPSKSNDKTVAPTTLDINNHTDSNITGNRLSHDHSSGTFQSQEVLDIWDPLRMQWVDSLSPENRKAYLQDSSVNIDGKLIRTVTYKTQALLTALSESQGEQKFILFPSLPPEIRDLIWKYAKRDSSSTCYVQLNVKQDPGGTYDLVRGKQVLVPNPIIDAKFSYLFDVPGLFGACRESRSIVHDVYGEARIVAFNNYTRKPFLSGKGSCRFNFERDRLFLITRGSTTQLPECVEFMKNEERRRIRHLAIPLKDYFHEAKKVVIALLNFSNLQTIDLVIGDGKDDLAEIGTRDYGKYMERSLRKQKTINDRELHEKNREQWTIPKVRVERINEVQARLWGIDCLKWDKTSRPIR